MISHAFLVAFATINCFVAAVDVGQCRIKTPRSSASVLSSTASPTDTAIPTDLPTTTGSVPIDTFTSGSTLSNIISTLPEKLTESGHLTDNSAIPSSTTIAESPSAVSSVATPSDITSSLPNPTTTSIAFSSRSPATPTLILKNGDFDGELITLDPWVNYTPSHVKMSVDDTLLFDGSRSMKVKVSFNGAAIAHIERKLDATLLTQGSYRLSVWALQDDINANCHWAHVACTANGKLAGDAPMVVFKQRQTWELLSASCSFTAEQIQGNKIFVQANFDCESAGSMHFDIIKFTRDF